MVKKAKLPEFLREYFWDVDFDTLTFKEDPVFILKRVLDRGNTTAIRWLLTNYSTKQIKDVVITSRDISQKTANFWALVLGIDRDRIKCLQKPYSRTQFGLYS